MLYIALFEDNPDADPAIRKTHMPAHLDFLEENADRIKAAGPLKTQEGEAAGGIWMIDAADADAVDSLIRKDPFWPTGLRQSVQVLNWTQVFADGRRQIDL